MGLPICSFPDNIQEQGIQVGLCKLQEHQCCFECSVLHGLEESRNDWILLLWPVSAPLPAEKLMALDDPLGVQVEEGASNTSSVCTEPSGPTESLIAFTTI